MGSRVHPEELDANYRNKNFEEVTKNLTKEQAVEEAKRCLHCKNARCVKGCPVNINIPEFIAKLKGVEKVEILPYHDLGKFKWEKLNLTYPLEGYKLASSKDVERAKSILKID